MRKKARVPRWLLAARAQDRSPVKTQHDWLSRALARAGVLPLVEAERAIVAGRVTLNGRVQHQPLAAFAPGDRIALDGRPVSVAAPVHVLMFHKPRGVVTSGRDDQNVGTVFQALAAVLPGELAGFGWHAVGRLDRNTTGLLLFTNDERVVAHGTSPLTHLPKTYLATVSGAPNEPKLRILREGITLDDGPTLPARARLRGPDLVELTLMEGRHHQVKRMLGAVGLPVIELHREAIGGVLLDVPVGQMRPLSRIEIKEGLSLDFV